MPQGKLTYRKGEIRWVKLDPTLGAEAQKTRACLTVQNDVMNQYGLLTIVIPLLLGHKQAPYAVNLTATLGNGLDRERYLDVAQIRSVSYQRILDPLGVIEEEYWQQIQTALNMVLDFVP